MNADTYYRNCDPTTGNVQHTYLHLTTKSFTDAFYRIVHLKSIQLQKDRVFKDPGMLFANRIANQREIEVELLSWDVEFQDERTEFLHYLNPTAYLDLLAKIGITDPDDHRRWIRLHESILDLDLYQIILGTLSRAQELSFRKGPSVSQDRCDWHNLERVIMALTQEDPSSGKPVAVYMALEKNIPQHTTLSITGIPTIPCLRVLVANTDLETLIQDIRSR